MIRTTNTIKMYKADNELAEILLKHGLNDITSEQDKKKGKRIFKTAREAHKVICFEYSAIKIIKSNNEIWRKYELSEDELKSILFYFTATSEYYREFFTDHYLNFDKFQDRLIALRKELDDFNEHKIHLLRRRIKQRILDYYDNFTI